MMETFCGTPITMAPEILQGKRYDRKCDVWSLGAVLFQLVYGKLPFPISEGYNVFIELVTTKELAFPSSPEMPTEFKDLLRGAMEKNSEARFDINDFLANKWIQDGNAALRMSESEGV